MATSDGNGLAVTAWVHSNTVTYSWFESMQRLAQHAAARNQSGEFSASFGGFLAMRYGTGALVEARNLGVAKFLATECEWLVWIDTDMGFNGDLVDRLVDSADPVDRPVMGALCFINSEVRSDGKGGIVTAPKPSIFFWGTSPPSPDGLTPEKTGFLPMIHYPKNAVVQCDGTGAAAIAIHRSVFERIRDGQEAKKPGSGLNWYGHIANPEGGQAFSEDLSFCIRCAEFGIPIHVNTGVVTTHMKPIWLTEDHHDQWLAACAFEREHKPDAA